MNTSGWLSHISQNSQGLQESRKLSNGAEHCTSICLNSSMLCRYTRLIPKLSADKSGTELLSQNSALVLWLQKCACVVRGMNITQMNARWFNVTNSLLIFNNPLHTKREWQELVRKKQQNGNTTPFFEPRLCRTAVGCLLNKKRPHSANPIQSGLYSGISIDCLSSQQNHCGISRSAKQQWKISPSSKFFWKTWQEFILGVIKVFLIFF